VEDDINKFTEVYVATNISEFSGKFLSYKKAKENINATFSTNSTITNTIATTGVKETVKDVKVKINLVVDNKLIEKYTPVAQYKIGGPNDPLGVGTWEIPNGTLPGEIVPDSLTNPYPGVPLYTENTPKSLATVGLNWYASPALIPGFVQNVWNKVGSIYVSSADPKKVIGINTAFLSQVAVGSDLYVYKSESASPMFAAPYLLGKVASVISDTMLELVSNFVPLIFSAGSTQTKVNKSYYFYDYVTPGYFGFPTGNTNFSYKFRSNTNNTIGASQNDFLSQNLIGLRKSDSLGVINLQWGFKPIGYAGPGYSTESVLAYSINNNTIASYGNVYRPKENVLDPISLNEISSTVIANGTTYSTSDEIYGYRIDISEDHLFGSYTVQYEVGLVYSYKVTGLSPDRYYYFRVMEVKSSGIGGLRMTLKSPNGQMIGLKEFNEGNDDTNMIDTVFSYAQDLPKMDTGKPIYEGTFKMNLDTLGNTCQLLTSENLSDHSLISKNNYADFTNLVGTTQYVNGDWTLSIENTSGVNIGHLQDWEIQFGYSDTLGAQLYDRTSAIDTGLKVVSNFSNANWKTGIWTNGVFDEGIFETGIWYNGVFNGTWG
jgi:subtilisin-like proprotein convertase family protein